MNLNDLFKKLINNDKAPSGDAESAQKKTKLMMVVGIVGVAAAVLLFTGGDDNADSQKQIGNFKITDDKKIAATRLVGEAVDDVSMNKRRIDMLDKQNQAILDQLQAIRGDMEANKNAAPTGANPATSDSANANDGANKSKLGEIAAGNKADGTPPNKSVRETLAEIRKQGEGKPQTPYYPEPNGDPKYGLSHVGEVPDLGMETSYTFTPMQGTLSYTNVNKIDTKAEDEAAQAKNAQRHTIPTGSIVKAILLSGMDAPTMTQAKTEPLPVLMRVTDLAIMPNRWNFDIAECFLMGEGYGELTSERAYIRVNNISCINNKGQTLDMPIKGSASGEDGKLGLKGEVVTKQGALLARSLVAAFLQGVGEAYGDYGDTIINGVGGTTTTNTAPGSEVFRGSLFQGMSKGAEKLADFYLKMADQVTPVIEISAGREIQILLTQPLDLTPVVAEWSKS